MKELPGSYALCKIKPQMSLPFWASHTQYLAVMRTPEAMSLVVDEQYVPPNIEAERGYKLFALEEGEEVQGLVLSGLNEQYLLKK